MTFRLHLPEEVTAPVVVASPHSGRVYDGAFLSSSVLDSDGIRSSEDAYVDMLLEQVPDLGVPLLLAQMPRAYLDLNRAAGELDPAVVQGVPRGAMNPRVSSGLGVIPRVVAQGRAIYRGKISQSEAMDRIETVWKPYHACLSEQLKAARTKFGRAILLDVHSMPHEAIEGTGPKGRSPEIVLGDRFGVSASDGLVEQLEAIFTDLGFRVARNAPFAGAYITQAYGRPSEGFHAIQIEIDRALYLDEARVTLNPEFPALRRLLTEAVSRFCEDLAPCHRLAAE